jgi:hypothetical protein
MIRLYADGQVAVWQVKTAGAVSFPREPVPAGATAAQPGRIEGYQAERWATLSTFLLAPYEVLRAIHPPFLALWEIQIGFPACLLLLGILLRGSQRIYPWLARRSWLLYLALCAFMGCLAALYLFSPAWFWGGSVPPVDPTSLRPAGL